MLNDRLGNLRHLLGDDGLLLLRSRPERVLIPTRSRRRCLLLNRLLLNRLRLRLNMRLRLLRRLVLLLEVLLTVGLHMLRVVSDHLAV